MDGSGSSTARRDVPDSLFTAIVLSNSKDREYAIEFGTTGTTWRGASDSATRLLVGTFGWSDAWVFHVLGSLASGADSTSDCVAVDIFIVFEANSQSDTKQHDATGHASIEGTFVVHKRTALFAYSSDIRDQCGDGLDSMFILRFWY